MANTTLEKIQQAEQQARDIVAEAKQQADSIVKDAQANADHRHTQEIEAALTKASELKNEAKKSAEVGAQPMQAESQSKQDALRHVNTENLNSAARRIVERIVEENGN